MSTALRLSGSGAAQHLPVVEPTIEGHVHAALPFSVAAITALADHLPSQGAVISPSSHAAVALAYGVLDEASTSGYAPMNAWNDEQLVRANGTMGRTAAWGLTDFSVINSAFLSMDVVADVILNTAVDTRAGGAPPSRSFITDAQMSEAMNAILGVPLTTTNVAVGAQGSGPGVNVTRGVPNLVELLLNANASTSSLAPGAQLEATTLLDVVERTRGNGVTAAFSGRALVTPLPKRFAETYLASRVDCSYVSDIARTVSPDPVLIDESGGYGLRAHSPSLYSGCLLGLGHDSGTYLPRSGVDPVQLRPGLAAALTDICFERAYEREGPQVLSARSAKGQLSAVYHTIRALTAMDMACMFPVLTVADPFNSPLMLANPDRDFLKIPGIRPVMSGYILASAISVYASIPLVALARLAAEVVSHTIYLDEVEAKWGTTTASRLADTLAHVSRMPLPPVLAKTIAHYGSAVITTSTAKRKAVLVTEGVVTPWSPVAFSTTSLTRTPRVKHDLEDDVNVAYQLIRNNQVALSQPTINFAQAVSVLSDVSAALVILEVYRAHIMEGGLQRVTRLEKAASVLKWTPVSKAEHVILDVSSPRARAVASASTPALPPIATFCSPAVSSPVAGSAPSLVTSRAGQQYIPYDAAAIEAASASLAAQIGTMSLSPTIRAATGSRRGGLSLSTSYTFIRTGVNTDELAIETRPAGLGAQFGGQVASLFVRNVNDPELWWPHFAAGKPTPVSLTDSDPRTFCFSTSRRVVEAIGDSDAVLPNDAETWGRLLRVRIGASTGLTVDPSSDLGALIRSDISRWAHLIVPPSAGADSLPELIFGEDAAGSQPLVLREGWVVTSASLKALAGRPIVIFALPSVAEQAVGAIGELIGKWEDAGDRQEVLGLGPVPAGTLPEVGTISGASFAEGASSPVVTLGNDALDILVISTDKHHVGVEPVATRPVVLLATQTASTYVI